MSLSFSVVTPSFNQGEFIRATIESVLGQQYPGLQYVVIDGGSRDETVSILREFGDRLKFVSEPDDGTGDAINKGLALCSGEIIGWLNSDDIYYPGALERVSLLFDRHPEVEVIYGRAHHIDESGRVTEEYATREWSFDELINHCIISQPAAFFRRRAIEQYGPLDTEHKYCLDYEFWIRLAKRGAGFLFVPEFFAATRLHDRAKTVISRLQCHSDINDIMVKHLGHVPARWISNYAHVKAEKLVFRTDRQLRFIPVLVAHCLLADLRWNKRISRSTLRMISGWIAGRVSRITSHS
jgi:GT2 family glycosyltransferase